MGGLDGRGTYLAAVHEHTECAGALGDGKVEIECGVLALRVPGLIN